MTLKIYGTAASRAIRPLWAAEELGLAYEHVPLHYKGPEVRQAEYLALNPNAMVPVLDDNGLLVFESLAITLHLAHSRPDGDLWATSVQDVAHIYQWTLWAATEAETLARQWFHHTSFLPEAQRIPRLADEALAKLQVRLQVLDAHLADREYLVGDRFTVADLNLAAVLQRMEVLARGELPHARAWHQRCMARPAAQRAYALKQPA